MLKSKFLIYFLLLIYFAIVIYFRLVEPYDGILFPMDLSYLAASLVAVIAVAYSMVKTKGKAIHSFVIVAGAGVIFWFLGEVSWVYYELATKSFPYPSVADFFYILAYPCWLYAVIREVKIDYLSTAVNGKWFWPSFLVVFIAAAITFYFGIIKSYDTEAPLLTNITNISYGLSDLMVVVVGGILAAISRVRGLNVKEFSLISLAMFFTWVADILYYTIFMEPYNNLVVPFRMIDIFWVTWYLLMAYAFHLFSKEEASAE